MSELTALNSVEYSSYFLKYTKFLMKLTGTWRLSSEKWYKIFSITLQLNFIIFEITLFIGGTLGLIDSDDPGEVNDNLTFQMFFFMTIWKMVLCQKAMTVRVIEDINIVENDVRCENDKTVNKIFNKFSLYSFKIIAFISLCMLLQCIFFLAMFVQDIIFVVRNGGDSENVKPPYIQWLPFKWEDNLKLSVYAYQTINGIIGGFLNISSDALIFSLIYFPLCRLKILSFKFMNFQYYSDKINDVPDQFLKILIREHCGIIR